MAKVRSDIFLTTILYFLQRFSKKFGNWQKYNFKKLQIGFSVYCTFLAQIVILLSLFIYNCYTNESCIFILLTVQPQHPFQGN